MKYHHHHHSHHLNQPSTS